MREVEQLVRETGLTVIEVVHDLNLAAQFADYLVLMKDARIAA